LKLESFFTSFAPSQRSPTSLLIHLVHDPLVISPLSLLCFNPYIDGFIASAIYHLNTSVLEGMNNRIKVIKRMAYGYRDNEYFFLKIKAAFPRLPR